MASKNEDQGLKAKLSIILKSAMKAGDKKTVTFARNLHAAIRKKEIDTRVGLDDDGIQKIVGSLLKQRRDSIEQFKQGGREDLVDAEESEVRFLEQFMPPQLDEHELEHYVSEAVSASGATSVKDMGKVMGILMAKVQGRADGKKINQMVRAKLSESS